MSRIILHFNINSFFAKVEQGRDRELAGRSVIVCEPRRNASGVVVCVSPEALKGGVRVGMSVRHALRTCSDAVVIRPDYSAYEEVFDDFLDLLYKFSPMIEPESLGRAYLDITASIGLFGSVKKIARTIYEETQALLGFDLSIGCAENKLLARMASGLGRKFTMVNDGCGPQFLAPLPIDMLSAVDSKSKKRLVELGVGTVGKLADLPESLLIKQFGHVGSLLYKQSHGQDFSQVKALYPRDTIIIEHPCGFVLEEPDDVELYIAENMLEQITRRLSSKNRLAGVISLMLFDDVTGMWSESEAMFKSPTASAYTISQTIRKLIDQTMETNTLVGRIKITLSELTSGEVAQLSLIDAGKSNGRLTGVVETLKDRFGNESVFFASSVVMDIPGLRPGMGVGC